MKEAKEALVLLGWLDVAHECPPLGKLSGEEITRIEKSLPEAGLSPKTVYWRVV